MKTLLYLVLASVFVISSCSNSNGAIDSKDLSVNNYPQTWKLIKITGSMAGSESVGQEMEWQENYVFKSDGSFIKTRNTDGKSESASGSYIFEDNIQNFLLEYNESSPIIGSCGPANKESLYLNEESKILQSNWWACDGPGLFYERLK